LNIAINGAARSAKFLASVMSADEARICVQAGADIIDCKNPLAGALGALPVELVRTIVASVPGSVAVSATVGDLPNEPELVAGKVMDMAASGVRYVKVGFFERQGARETVRRLGELDLGTCRLVGLLLADRDPDFDLVCDMAQAGFAGAMLDTAEKSGGALPLVLSSVRIGAFIDTAHEHRLFAGLAGSLRIADVAPLSALGPDILGFRGALCARSDRRSEIDRDSVSAVARAMTVAGRSRAGHGAAGAVAMEASS
jgi:uncharacterized protein (UPF0264 family)